jgi:hypothetical protein
VDASEFKAFVARKYFRVKVGTFFWIILFAGTFDYPSARGNEIYPGSLFAGTFFWI